MRNDTDSLKKRRYLNFLIAGILAPLMISVIILSWVPPVSRDALTHHLAIPKLYLAHGSMHEIPSMAVSYYPMNVDLLYVIPLYFGNDIVPKFIHFVFALLTAWLIYAYLENRLGAVWAIFGSIFFLSLPIIVKLSITVYVDLGLVFFSTAALISLLKWIENQFQVRFLIVSAICCGLALGTKYNGLILFFVLTLFIPFLFMRKLKTTLNTKNSANNPALINIQLKALGFGVLFALTALLVFSPWMIRNYVWKANPIYPLHDHLFNCPKPVTLEPQIDPQILGTDADSQPPSDANRSAWSSIAMRSIIYGESWWEIALIPVRIFFQGQDNSPKHFDGKLSPFLLLLPFFAFFQETRDSATLRVEKKFFIFFAILLVMFTFCTTSIRIRYIAPIIPPLVILSTYGFQNIASAFRNRWQHIPYRFSKAFIILLGIALLSYNGLYIAQQFSYVQPLSYLSGQVSRDAYIEKYRPEFAVYQYANRWLPDRSKILALFLGNRRYYSDREMIFGVKEFQESINRSDSAEILRMDLKKRGYTHVLIRFDLFNWWMGRQFRERKNEILHAFFSAYLEPLFSQNGYGLFALR